MSVDQDGVFSFRGFKWTGAGRYYDAPFFGFGETKHERSSKCGFRLD
jgi:hypothetical protein